MIGRIVPALLALGLLAACTSTPYPTPVIEPVQGAGPQAFAGLRELMDSGSGVRALWTHGMCTHKPSWVQDRSNRVSIALGLGPDAWKPPFDGIAEGPSFKLPRRFTVDGKTLDIDFFLWSPRFVKDKRTLHFDAPKGNKDEDGVRLDGEFPYHRAELNNALKVELLNDCLADAVLYSGARSQALREEMREAVCATLDGRPVAGGCDVSGATDPRPVVFVTESLGSKFLFDAVRDLWDATGRRSATQQAALGDRLANVRMLFMLANQIPLLDLADASPGTARVAAAAGAAPSSMGTFLDLVAGAKRSRARTAAPSAAVSITDPLTVVAFTDPGDLLSYRLLVSKLARNPDTVRLFNVLTSNGPIYFGLVQRPDTAHCGYAYNAYVIGLMVLGHQPGKPLPTVPVTGVGRC